MGWVVLGSAVLIVLLVILEGRRQERRYGRGSGRGGSLMRAGMLEFQRHLEPERKVEMILQEREQTDRSDSGDPPVPGPDEIGDRERQ